MQHCFQTRCNEAYIHNGVPRIAISRRPRWISIYWFSCTHDPGHAKPDQGSRFMQKHERIGSQYKSKMSNIIVTLFYTISCYYTHWRPLQSSSSSLRAPLSVLLSRCSGSQSQLLQVVHQLVIWAQNKSKVSMTPLQEHHSSSRGAIRKNWLLEGHSVSQSNGLATLDWEVQGTGTQNRKGLEMFETNAGS
jgi:hypothetical protein